MNPDKNIHESEKRLREAFGKETAFTTPEGYFEDLPDRTMDAIRQSSGKHARLSGIRKFAAAASIIILLGLFALLIFSNRDSSMDESIVYSQQNLYEMSINSLFDLEDTYILSLVGDEQPEIQNLMGIDSLSISQDDIREYLLAESNIEYMIINNY